MKKLFICSVLSGFFFIIGMDQPAPDQQCCDQLHSVAESRFWKKDFTLNAQQWHRQKGKALYILYKKFGFISAHIKPVEEVEVPSVKNLLGTINIAMARIGFTFNDEKKFFSPDKIFFSSLPPSKIDSLAPVFESLGSSDIKRYVSFLSFLPNSEAQKNAVKVNRELKGLKKSIKTLKKKIEKIEQKIEQKIYTLSQDEPSQELKRLQKQVSRAQKRKVKAEEKLEHKMEGAKNLPINVIKRKVDPTLKSVCLIEARSPKRGFIDNFEKKFSHSQKALLWYLILDKDEFLSKSVESMIESLPTATSTESTSQGLGGKVILKNMILDIVTWRDMCSDCGDVLFSMNENLLLVKKIKAIIQEIGPENLTLDKNFTIIVRVSGCIPYNPPNKNSLATKFYSRQGNLFYNEMAKAPAGTILNPPSKCYILHIANPFIKKPVIVLS